MRHTWTIEERRNVVRHDPLPPEVVLRTRAVCSCGVTTRWNVDERRMRKERDRHALEGQTSIEL